MKFVKSTSPATTAPIHTAAMIPNSFFPLMGSFSACIHSILFIVYRAEEGFLLVLIFSRSKIS